MIGSLVTIFRVRGRSAQARFRQSKLIAHTRDMRAVGVDVDGHFAPQLAFAVPKKFGNSVARNRARRVLRDELRSKLSADDGAVLIQIRPSAKELDVSALRLQVVDLLQRFRVQQQRKKSLPVPSNSRSSDQHTST